MPSSKVTPKEVTVEHIVTALSPAVRGACDQAGSTYAEALESKNSRLAKTRDPVRMCASIDTDSADLWLQHFGYKSTTKRNRLDKACRTVVLSMIEGDIDLDELTAAMIVAEAVRDMAQHKKVWHQTMWENVPPNDVDDLIDNAIRAGIDSVTDIFCEAAEEEEEEEEEEEDDDDEMDALMAAAMGGSDDELDLDELVLDELDVGNSSDDDEAEGEEEKKEEDHEEEEEVEEEDFDLPLPRETKTKSSKKVNKKKVEL
jgi:hypothetical protein